MNSNLRRAIEDLDKVDALMYVIEKSCLNLEVYEESQRDYDRGTGAFYALWDAINKVAEDLDRLTSDEMVIDAIYAVNDVKRQKGSLITEQ